MCSHHVKPARLFFYTFLHNPTCCNFRYNPCTCNICIYNPIYTILSRIIPIHIYIYIHVHIHIYIYTYISIYVYVYNLASSSLSGFLFHPMLPCSKALEGGLQGRSARFQSFSSAGYRTSATPPPKILKDAT